MKQYLLLTLFAMSIFTPLTFAEEGTSTVDVDGTTHDVSYDATSLTVDGMEADTATETLTVFVTTEDVDSSLEIVLERSFFDSQTDSQDDDFLILADGLDVQFDETKTDTTRILSFDVPVGTNLIDIIALGTSGFDTSEETIEEPEPTEETPEETPEETEPEETEEPQTECGPGTVLEDGVCVLITEPEETPEETEPEETEEPQTECGPGTMLKDGACVLDERCGPGTIFKDGTCVLADAPEKPKTSRGSTFELGAGVIAAFVIAFIVMIILWAIGRASRSKNNN